MNSSFSLLPYLEKQAPAFLSLGMSLESQSLSCCANIDTPEQIKQYYQNMLNAGADLIGTNTAGANRLHLQSTDYADRIEAINNNGMALLREALQFRGIACGLVNGAPSHTEPPPLDIHKEQAYGEQFIYLSDTGAQLFVLQGFSSMDDLKIALRVGTRNLPHELVAHAPWTAEDTQESLFQKIDQLYEWNADFVGVECLASDFQISMIEALLEKYGVLSLILGESSGNQQEVSPEFQNATQDILQTDVAILGSGVNTSFEHVKVMKSCFQAAE